MKISFSLLERLFTNIEAYYTIEETRCLGLLFFSIFKNTPEYDGQEKEFWIQMASLFDTKFFYDNGHRYMSIYRQSNGNINTQDSPILTMLLDKSMTF